VSRGDRRVAFSGGPSMRERQDQLSVHEEYDEREGHRRRAAPTARLIVGAVLLVVVIAVVVDNRQGTTVGYVFGNVRAPLIVVMLASAVAGGLVGWLLLHRARRER
jgi:uncharacterized integral membrane protein